MTLDQAVQLFRTHQEAAGCSPHTVRAYHLDLKLLIQLIGGDTQVASITTADLDNFLLDPRVTHKANSLDKKVVSVNRTWVSLRAFFGWLLESNYINRDPSAGLPIRYKGYRHPFYLKEDQVASLLSAFHANSGWQAERDLAILSLMLNTGIHLSELINLNLGDVDLLEKRITIQAKGGQHATRFLNYKIRVALRSYIKARVGFSVNTDALFINRAGKRISTRQIQSRFDEWAESAGIKKRVTTNVLRRTFAASLYSRPDNLLGDQQALGYASVLTTQVHAHQRDDIFEEVMESL